VLRSESCQCLCAFSCAASIVNWHAAPYYYICVIAEADLRLSKTQLLLGKTYNFMADNRELGHSSPETSTADQPLVQPLKTGDLCKGAQPGDQTTLSPVLALSIDTRILSLRARRPEHSLVKRTTGLDHSDDDGHSTYTTKTNALALTSLAFRRMPRTPSGLGRNKPFHRRVPLTVSCTNRLWQSPTLSSVYPFHLPSIHHWPITASLRLQRCGF
jgi:hypothetical protein